MKQLKLSYPHYSDKISNISERTARENLLYRVEQVIGSTAYDPGQYLKRSEVTDLCEQTGVWKITITTHD